MKHTNYLTFSKAVHDVLIRHGCTHITCLSEIDKRMLKPTDRKKRCFAVYAHAYDGMSDKEVNTTYSFKNAVLLDAPAEIKITDLNVAHSIKSIKLTEMYNPTDDTRFYLVLPMENESFRVIYSKIKWTNIFERFRN